MWCQRCVPRDASHADDTAHIRKEPVVRPPCAVTVVPSLVLFSFFFFPPHFLLCGCSGCRRSCVHIGSHVKGQISWSGQFSTMGPVCFQFFFLFHIRDCIWSAKKRLYVTTLLFITIQSRVGGYMLKRKSLLESNIMIANGMFIYKTTISFRFVDRAKVEFFNLITKR